MLVSIVLGDTINLSSSCCSFNTKRETLIACAHCHFPLSRLILKQPSWLLSLSRLKSDLFRSLPSFWLSATCASWNASVPTRTATRRRTAIPQWFHVSTLSAWVQRAHRGKRALENQVDVKLAKQRHLAFRGPFILGLHGIKSVTQVYCLYIFPLRMKMKVGPYFIIPVYCIVLHFHSVHY